MLRDLYFQLPTCFETLLLLNWSNSCQSIGSICVPWQSLRVMKAISIFGRSILHNFPLYIVVQNEAKAKFQFLFSESTTRPSTHPRVERPWRQPATHSTQGDPRQLVGKRLVGGWYSLLILPIRSQAWRLRLRLCYQFNMISSAWYKSSWIALGGQTKCCMLLDRWLSICILHLSKMVWNTSIFRC